MKRHCFVLTYLPMAVLLISATAQAASVADRYAGFSVDLDDPQHWISQLTHTPGLTSKLCLIRETPKVLLCLQSLHAPIDGEEVSALARGFVDAIADRFSVSAPTDLAAQKFGELSGYVHWFELSPSAAPAGLADVWLFAGTGPAGQPQMVIAFSSPAERQQATAQVAAALNAVRYGTDDL